MKITEAIILAGGLGTRLRSAVPDLPKCMAAVSGKPFLYYVITYLQKQGIEKFILSLGYKYEVIEKYITTEFGILNFKFSVETEPLGTGGGLMFACTKAAETSVLVVNGDTFFKVDLQKLSAFHNKCGADCTLSLKPMKHFERYGVVRLNKDNSIESFQEKKYYADGLINGGVYALNVQNFLLEKFSEIFSFEKDYLEHLYLHRRIFGIIQDEYFIDIGIPEDYEKAQQELISKLANVKM